MLGAPARYLFVVGCPRSGTTALWRLLVEHPQVVIGVERYGVRFLRPEFIDPSLYERERFFRVEPGDTHYADLDAFTPEYARMRDRYDDAFYRGDKIPWLYRHLPRLLATFGPEVRVIFVFRNIFDVASSYEQRHVDPTDTDWTAGGTDRAIADWSDAIAAATAYAGDPRFLSVQHEQLFLAGKGYERLRGFLELPASPAMDFYYARSVARASELEASRRRELGVWAVDLVTRTAPFDAYRRLVGS